MPTSSTGTSARRERGTLHDDELPIDADVAAGDHLEPNRVLRADPRVLAAIALGGALGAPARYGVAQLIHVRVDAFPWATFWTNVTGSLALGFVLALLLERFPPTRYVRPFVATGFIGAYTTYSTFAVETDVLIKNGHAGVAVAYALASLAAGFAAVWIGLTIARVWRVR